MAPIESSSVVGAFDDLPARFSRSAAANVVWIRGEQDVSTVAALSETLARAISLDDSDLVVDLSDVEFMSAATVGVLVRARQFLRSFSRSLQVQSPSTCARRILALCNLGDLLDDRAVGNECSMAGVAVTVSSLEVRRRSGAHLISVAGCEGS
jgi:anti-anti-sigma factor